MAVAALKPVLPRPSGMQAMVLHGLMAVAALKLEPLLLGDHHLSRRVLHGLMAVAALKLQTSPKSPLRY